eukprot:Nitzschia sp. Nitz4//scaffold54_size114964//47880//48596//NITZ4_003848-RA/size114964-processed-gene-0.185-mRNA-1//-1//CDS//3329554342//5504//frame0
MLSAYRNSVYSIVGRATRRVFETPKRFGSSSPPPASAETGIGAFAKENPFIFQLGVATAKTAAADIVAQVVAERKSFSEIDWKRNALFVLFGFTYLGGFQYYLMVNKYRHWFPTMDRFGKLPFAEKLKDTAGIIDAAKMVMFDVCIHLPIIYFPTYYAVKEFVFGDSWSPVDWVQVGVTKYVNNAKDDLTACWSLWFPSDCIQFILPIHIRLPFRHVVSFFWTAYVSFTRGAAEAKEE